ncbi:monocarboxylate permease-like protein [Nemania sp. FL0031]|nr:monocarboxylate permease-like protein [Nemania sp. FL0031]
MEEKPPLLVEQADDKYPEGGWKAWGVAAGTSFTLFCSLGYVNSFGVYQAYYMTHQLSDQEPSRIAWIGSLQFYLVFSAGVFGGPLFDLYGAKVMWLPVVFYVLSIMLTSISYEYYHFILAQGLFGGLANGMVMNPAMAATSQYFQKKRGAAIGLAIAGSSVGGVIFPLALSRLLSNPTLGFGWSVRIPGFIILLILAVACLLIKERIPPRKQQFFLPGAFAEKQYILVIAAGFFLFLGFFSPYFFLPDYAISYGFDPENALYLVAILNGASFPGRVIPGILSDKLGRYNMLASAGIITSILLFVWTKCTSRGAIYAFAALYGLFSGGVISGLSVTLASTTTNPLNIGTYLGQAMPLCSLASLIGPPISGAFLATYHGYRELAIFSGVACILGSAIVFAAKSTTKEGILGAV